MKRFLSVLGLVICAVNGGMAPHTCAFAATSFNVLDYGAIGDGAADDTSAFQDALDAAEAAGGGIALVPPGNYRIATGLTIATGVTLRGIFNGPPAANGPRGSTLLAVNAVGGEAGTPLLQLQTGAAVNGLVIYHPDQPGTTPYPPAVVCRGDRITLLNLGLVNPWIGIDFTVAGTGHHLRGISGQPLHMGVRGFSGGTMEAVHFAPLWNGAFNGETAFDFQGAADAEVLDCSASGYDVGFRLGASGDLLITNCVITDAAVAISVVNPDATHSASFATCTLTGGVEVDANHAASLTFTGCALTGRLGQTSLVALHGTGAVIFKACTFSGWDQGQAGAACIEVDPAAVGGSPLILTSCQFGATRNDTVKVRLSDKVREATIAANVMQGGVLIDNQSSATTGIGIGNNVAEGLGR